MNGALTGRGKVALICFKSFQTYYRCGLLWLLITNNAIDSKLERAMSRVTFSEYRFRLPTITLETLVALN